MWLIFIIACIVVALAALIVIYIGHKIIQKIERDDRVSDVEDEAYEQAKKIIRNQYMEDNRKYGE